MKKILFTLVVQILTFAVFGTENLENQVYSIRMVDEDTVVIAHKEGGEWMFDLSFCVLYSDVNPKLGLRKGWTDPVSYNTTTWENKALEQSSEVVDTGKNNISVGDGFDPRILEASNSNRTANLFNASPRSFINAKGVQLSQDGFRYTFPDHPAFQFDVTLTLPAGQEPPVLRYTFVTKMSGYYSVGYVGAPQYKMDELDEIFQSMLWQEKRFPNTSIMTLAYRCTVPSTFITKDGVTLGVVADPEDFPFEELPLMDNSRFGVAVHNRDHLAQPMLFAPVLGGKDSKMQSGQRFSFTMRPVIVKGDSTVAFEHIARSMYGFKDYRTNAICSLNQTLENMVDYGMSHWSRFLEDQKGCSYDTDAPGTVKNVSSLNPLELAIITDNEDIFNRRAYPYIEYMLSRKKFLFTVDEKQKIQSPSYTLEGPCAPVSELTSLYTIFERGTPAFLKLAEKEFNSSRVRNLDDVETGKSWDNALFMYLAGGDKQYLDLAVQGADKYIQRRIDTAQVDFKDPNSPNPFFWTAFVPNFIDLLELYEVTGEKKYLDAAHKGARQFTQFTWMSPAIPDKDILVNEGGKAPLYWYLKSKGHKQMSIPEETVPAWRLSSMGLTPESSVTCSGHRAIFMANYAPWLIRIGYYADDPYLSEIGRSAILGRYCNFPGYHMNTARTTAYEKADYPLREHKELSVNSFHYNHIWPMMSMLVDYLVTEAMVRSDGAIRFPSKFIEGYAYLQNKFYGTQPGSFYNNDDAILWMPKGLLKIDNVEVNYIAARGENRLYLAFMNESFEPVTAQVSLNNELIPQGSYTIYTRKGSDKPQRGEMIGNKLAIEIPPKGITAITVEGVDIVSRFQYKVMGATDEKAWSKGFAEFEDPAGRAMVLNLGKVAKTVYVYLKDSKKDFSRVDMVYDLGDGQKRITDESFPWEFTVPIDSDVERFLFKIVGTGNDGKEKISETIKLNK
jgi:hypothetical protein